MHEVERPTLSKGLHSQIWNERRFSRLLSCLRLRWLAATALRVSYCNDSHSYLQSLELDLWWTVYKSCWLLTTAKVTFSTSSNVLSKMSNSQEVQRLINDYAMKTHWMRTPEPRIAFSGLCISMLCLTHNGANWIILYINLTRGCFRFQQKNSIWFEN